MDINIRIAGEAGQGVQTIGMLFVNTFAGVGLHVFATQSYMSRIRGGLNWFDIRIADVELFSGKEETDLLIALTERAYQELSPKIAGGGKVLFNGIAMSGTIPMEFPAVAKQTGGSAVMANAVAAGAAFAILNYDLESLCAGLTTMFQKMGAESVAGNVACARRGYELAHAAGQTVSAPAGGNASGATYNGSVAVGLAAATAGVKLVSSYPMTPSSGVFTCLAGLADEYGIVVEQAEDEIAAINMICGATYAGVPAMTTTSGGGFALMAEGLSLAGMLELPAFVILSQRPGPATGLPTRTGQEDLKFAVNAGHGEFARAIYAPGSAAQAYQLTRHALQSAHKYQTPAILLLDQFLADQCKNLPELDRTLRPIDRHVVKHPAPDYVRYAITSDVVSPRALPGGEVFVVCDSDEHTKDGHITEDLNVRLRLQNKRLRKIDGLTAEFLPPERYGPPDAQALLLAWGSTYGPCREAVDILNANDHHAAMLHFAQVWPLNAEVVRNVIGERASAAAQPARRVICVEGNATGQFASLLREQGVLAECELILKYDGMPFTGAEIGRRAGA